MSLLVLAPDLLESATTDLGSIGSALNAAHATTAAPTTALVAAGADEVSAAVAALFAGHGQQFQALSAQAAAFHSQFVQALRSGVRSYRAAEAANASPLQALEQGARSALNAPAEALLGRPLIGNGPPGTAANAAIVSDTTPTNVTVPLHMNTISTGTYPQVNVSVNGGRSVPVLVDTGGAGLVIPWRYVGLAHLGLPRGIGIANYDAGVKYLYLKFNTTVNFGNGAVTAPTTVDVSILAVPTSPRGLETLISGQAFGGSKGDLGLGPSIAGSPATPLSPNNIVTTALPGDLNQGELINETGGYLEFGPNPLTPIPGTATSPTTAAIMNVEVNGVTKQVTVVIDSGGSVGAIPSSFGPLPVGSQITVFAGDGTTPLYQQTTTATDSPEVVRGSQMNTGNYVFANNPVYISNSPSGMGEHDGTITIDMP